jgi:hypothetical protein
MTKRMVANVARDDLTLVFMPRHEPSGRQSAGEPPNLKVKMRLEKGRFVPVEEPRELNETTEAAERPPTPDDPRPTAFLNVPPFGGAV